MSAAPQDPPGVGFPPVSRETWRRRVEEELGGREVTTLSGELPGGLPVHPLYADDSAAPDRLPVVPRSGVRPWRIAVEVPTMDALPALEEDLTRGAELAWLAPTAFPALGAVLDALKGQGKTLVLDSGSGLSSEAAAARDLLRRRPVDGLAVYLGLDPLAELARRGSAASPLETAFDLLVEEARRAVEGPGEVRAALVSVRPWHEAGATVVDEVAAAISGGLEVLRHLLAAGLDLEAAADQLLFSMALDTDIFSGIAKLRATHRLWAKALVASGASPRAPRLHVRTAASAFTARDPWLNLLRGGYQGLQGAVTGAWALTIAPYDTPLGVPSSAARRHAISTHHLLAEESHLGRVADPAAGSGYLESLTENLARAAWDRCRAIESLGGLGETLRGGHARSWVEESAQKQAQAVAKRRAVIVGVSEFANLAEERPERPPFSAEPEASVDDPMALVPRHRSAPFEALRDRSEALAERRGHAPQVGVVGLGPLKEYGPRADWIRSFFAAGGILAVPEADAEGALDAVVFCGTDERYPEEVPAALDARRNLGQRRFYLAGRPPELKALAAAGVNTFLYRGLDVAAVLSELLDTLEEETP